MAQGMSTYRIERLGHLGDGLTAEGLIVPRSLPGEVVTGVPEGRRLSDVRIETPVPTRVRPPCPHFNGCGGCQLQHASDEFVADWKTGLVTGALKRHGLSAPVQVILTSPPRSRRRATFAARRTRTGAVVGFHGRRSDSLVDIPGCLLVMPEILAARAICADLARVGGSRKTTLAITVTFSEDGLDLAVAGGKPQDRTLWAELADLAERHDVARLAWDADIVVTRRPPYQVFGGARVVPPPGAFLQATAEGEAQLVSKVSDIVGASKQVVDLFAGCGTFALPLARRAEVDAFEGDASMVEAMDRGWRHASGLKRLRASARDLFRNPLTRDELAGYDAVVIDPPRAGAAAQITELAHSDLGLMAYVSCNPETFARDAAHLVSAGWTLDHVLPVDQFRWSAHVELVARLSRA